MGGELQAEGAAGKSFFGDGLTGFLGLEAGLLRGVPLQKPMEFRLGSPATLEVVVMEPARVGLADDGVPPAGKLHREAGGFAGIEAEGALRGSREAQAAAGGGDRHGITDLGGDGDQVRHGNGAFRKREQGGSWRGPGDREQPRENAERKRRSSWPYQKPANARRRRRRARAPATKKALNGRKHPAAEGEGRLKVPITYKCRQNRGN